MAAIELRGVTRHFGDVTALRDLDLTVEDGEIFGFLGPNGAGKTTAIDVMLDYIRPDAGTATVLGLDTREAAVGIRRRAGILPDGYSLFPTMTGREHLAFAIDAHEGRADQRPEGLLERVGLEPAADRRAGGYSKGMAQRLALAMALVGEPDLLVLDEPTTGLDPAGARRVRRIVEAERDRGATVFFSSHIMEQVEAVCDRVGILRDGDLVAVDTIDGLRAAAGGTGALELDVALDGVDREPLRDRLRALDGVDGVEFTDGTLATTCEDAAKADVVATCLDAGVEVTDIRHRETSLEELFVAYTGVEG